MIVIADSVIYIERLGEWNPEMGDYLGDMTDELDGGEITEFVSGGPKVCLVLCCVNLINKTLCF